MAGYTIPVNVVAIGMEAGAGDELGARPHLPLSKFSALRAWQHLNQGQWRLSNALPNTRRRDGTPLSCG